MEKLSFAEIDNTVNATLEPPGRMYWTVVALLFCGVLVGAACWGWQILVGIGAGGQNNPVNWGTYLINFVFWVGIAHSGTLISAILYLLRGLSTWAGCGWSTTCCPCPISAHCGPISSRR